MTEEAIEKSIPETTESTDEAAPTELGEPISKMAEALHEILDPISTWRTPEGEFFATIRVKEHLEHYSIRSREFQGTIRAMMARRYTKAGRPAAISDYVMREALLTLEARAMIAGATHCAPFRVTEYNNTVYIDCGTPDWSVIAVNADGWRRLPTAPVPLIRSLRSGAFDVEKSAVGFESLRKLLSHLDEDSFTLIVAWLLSALLPYGPYPILIFGGEMGSGKSMLARLCRSIVDPSTSDLLQPPENNRDLIAQAKSHRILAFDNCSSISSELADSFCRLSTGGELGGRALYSDHDLATFKASRPMLLNGIPDLATRGDLAERCMVIRLPRLPHRKTERQMQQDYASVIPAVRAALLDALSCGLAKRDKVGMVQTRMADFCQFIVAAEQMLPWSKGQFLRAYEWNQKQAIAALTEGDAVASAIQRLMEHCTEWSGTVTQLYEEATPQSLQRPSDWPGNPSWFSNRLRRCSPTLRAIGIEVIERRSAQANMVTLTKASQIAPISTLATDGTDATSDGGSGANAANLETSAKSDDHDTFKGEL